MHKVRNELRAKFPIFSGKEGESRHYLDSAASSQKPAAVIDRLSEFLRNEHANIHRGAYTLSAKATESYDLAKEKVARFINAPDQRSIVFTKGATEGINLVAHAYEHNFKAGDSILITVGEHHSNIVPWQLLAKRKKLNLIFADLNDSADLNLDDFREKVERHKPKLVSFAHVTNSFGARAPAAELVELSKKAGAVVMIDAAQSVHHLGVDVANLGADFVAFSGHKMYGPTGIGVLYINRELASRLEPFQGGGDMISHVSTTGSEWAEFPQMFEAGTPPIAEAIALGTAVDFITEIGLKSITSHEEELFPAAWELLAKEEGVTLYGPAVKNGPASRTQIAIIPFNVAGIHPHDLATVVDSLNVQIRAGHHCAMPALKRLKLGSTARASIGMYSDITDFEALIEGIRKAKKLFAN